MLYLEIFAVCLCLNKAQGQSYQSSVNNDGRPILRTGESLDPELLQQSVKDVEPLWVAELRARIERLVSRHGYEAAKPFIEKTVDETQKKQSVLMDVKVDRDGESEVVFRYEPKHALRSGQSVLSPNLLTNREFKHALRSGQSHLSPNLRTNIPDPEWLAGFKAYVKSLINRYGRQSLDGHLRPIIDNLEKEQSVTISDVDVDSFGEVVVKYTKLKRKRTRSPWHGMERLRATDIPMDDK